MKALLLFAIVVGFGGTLAGAHFMPGLEHTRLPSHTSVVANGGRAEPFFVRLPADRIAATGGEAGGLRAPGGDGVMAVPGGLAGDVLRVEHFKVRDAAGSVIGVAARHWSVAAGGPATTWSLLVPSRGAMVLSARGEARGAVDSALQGSGYGPGEPWTGRVTVQMTPPGAPGELVAGTGEFEGLSGTYTETWSLAGVDATGQLLGTVELSTVTSQQR